MRLDAFSPQSMSHGRNAVSPTPHVVARTAALIAGPGGRDLAPRGHTWGEPVISRTCGCGANSGVPVSVEH